MLLAVVVFNLWTAVLGASITSERIMHTRNVVFASG